MSESGWLAEQFECHRPQLAAVSYRMLGSYAEAEEAVQDAWLRASRADADTVENLGGWLTTIVARVCLNRLRARTARREQPAGIHLPDPVVSPPERSGPEHEAVLADSVGLALQIVLDTLAPAERLAFVLHDLFALPFDDIATLLDRSPAATRQLASRARRRVRDVPAPDADLPRQRTVVEAFFAATREGDFGRLLAVLHPDVVLRSDGGIRRRGATQVLRGRDAIARRAGLFARPGARIHPVLVNGAAGAVVTINGQPISVMGFTVIGDTIAEIHSLLDPERLAHLDLSAIQAG